MDVRLLFVEDEATVRRHIARALRGAGHEILSAENGEQALSLAQAGRLDGLITDLGLPDMDANVLVSRLQKDLGALHVIVTTGAPDGARALLDVDPSARVLAKPFQIEELLEMVEALGRESAPARARTDRTGNDSGVLSRLSTMNTQHARPSNEGSVQGVAANARVSRLIERLHVGVIVLDARGAVVLCNPMACEQLGLSEDQLKHTSSFDPEWNCIHEDGSPFELEQYPASIALRTGNPVREIVMGIHRPAIGDRVWVLVSAHPEFAEDGEIQQVVVTLNDIGELRRLQQDLRQTRVMESLGGFVGGVAHDFNNLLTVIATSAEWLREKLPSGTEEQEEVVQILETAQRAGGLTHKLLTFARREPHRQLHVVSPDDVVRDVLQLARRTMGEDICIEQELEASPWYVEIDPTELEQVLVNLIVNARDAMPQGGRVRIRSGQVHGFTRQDGTADMVELTVEDSGVGISPHLVGRIFEPFFTTKDRGRGTGMGLATVYGIVRSAGGDIHAQSELGKGSVFRVRLPRSLQTSLRETTQRVTKSAPKAAPATILLVEDEAAVRFQARRILECATHRVIGCASGHEALEFLKHRADEVDLIITDVILPGCPGPEIARAACTAAGTPPVLYVSGYPDSRLQSAGITEARHHVLRKPYTRDGLLERVNVLLAHDLDDRSDVRAHEASTSA